MHGPAHGVARATTSHAVSGVSALPDASSSWCGTIRREPRCPVTDVQAHWTDCSPTRGRVCRGAREPPQRNLKSLLRIFRALIRYSSVEAGISSLAAAPEGPE